MLRRVGLRRTGISAKGRTPISRGSAPQGVSAKRKSQRVELAELRLFVLERDQYRCQWCRTRTQPLEMQHIIKRSQWPGGLLVASNCTTLCRTCHNWADNGDPLNREGRLRMKRLDNGSLKMWIDYEGKLARLAGALFLNGNTNQMTVENPCIAGERSVNGLGTNG